MNKKELKTKLRQLDDMPLPDKEKILSACEALGLQSGHAAEVSEPQSGRAAEVSEPQSGRAPGGAGLPARHGLRPRPVFALLAVLLLAAGLVPVFPKRDVLSGAVLFFAK